MNLLFSPLNVPLIITAVNHISNITDRKLENLGVVSGAKIKVIKKSRFALIVTVNYKAVILSSEIGLNIKAKYEQ